MVCRFHKAQRKHPERIKIREFVADIITLDGFALGEGAPAYFGYFGPDLERWIDEQSATPQILLMGRVTYEMMAGISQSGSDEPSKRMNELPKLVVNPKRTAGMVKLHIGIRLNWHQT